MSTLSVCLLGEFRLSSEGIPVTGVDTPRLQSLLAYLLLLHRDAPVARQQLAVMLWPDTHESQARTNLRNLLHQLHKRLPAAYRACLDYADKPTVQWRQAAGCVVDVVEFEKLLRTAERHRKHDDHHDELPALEAALALYRGDLLPGCYDSWAEPERDRLNKAYLEALERMVQVHAEHRDYPTAIRHAEQLLRSDPLREASSLWLMRLLALNGDYANGIRVYRDLEQRLIEEFGIEPGMEAQELYRRLLTRSVLAAPSEPRPAHLAGQWPLVNRRAEWQLLMTTWKRVAQGSAHWVLLSGEAGIGKTRLAEELLAWAETQGIASARARAYDIGGVAFGPLGDWLRAHDFQDVLAQANAVWLTEVARILPELLLHQPRFTPPAPFTDSWQRKHFFDALAHVFLAGDRPTILLLDDLHWCDQDTIDWLQYLLHIGARAPLLLVGTLRNDLNAGQVLAQLLLNLRRSQGVTEIELAALDEKDTVDLIAQVTGKPVARSAAVDLYHESEGNPLFVVETIRSEQPRAEGDGANPRAGRASLAPVIRTVIESRLNQLSAQGRELACIAATIGREFTLDVLVHAGNQELRGVAGGLEELLQRRIVREQGSGYYFTHDKLREVAYAGMNLARRRLHHQRVAYALKKRYASNPDAVSGQMAEHYAQAAMPDDAIACYTRAAEAARRVYALSEATRLLSAALALLRALPDAEQRAGQELALLNSLGPILMAMRGYASPETEQCFARTAELSLRLDRADPLLAAQQGLWVGHLVRADLRGSLFLAQHLHDLALQTEDPVRRMIGHTVMGMTYFHLGEPAAAFEHLDAAAALLRTSPQHMTPEVLYSFLGVNFEVNLLAYLQYVVWLLGDEHLALKLSEEAIATAQHAEHPYSQDYALAFGAVTSLLCRDPALTRERAERAIALSQQYGFAQWHAHETIRLGRTLVEEGSIDEGIAAMHRGLAEWQATGARLARSYYLGLLAEGYARAGQTEQGLAALDEAMAHAEECSERWWAAELHRVRGELLMGQGKPAAAETAFCAAAAIAERQQARPFELRAAIGLARLWRQQGYTAKAIERLNHVLLSFPADTITRDLQEGRDLLRQMCDDLPG